jgi:glutamate-ammonia-ligase adenylyltransferase
MAQLESELKGNYPHSWVRQHLASFPADYFRSFDSAEIGQHLESILHLDDEHPVEVRALAQGEGDWKIHVVGYDAFQFLSTLCTLLAVRGLSILTGRVFTSQPPPLESDSAILRRGPGPKRPSRPVPSRVPDRRPRIVDAFQVRLVRLEAGPPDWTEFETELTSLARLLRSDRYEEVHHRLIGRFVTALGPYRASVDTLEPIDLTHDVAASDTATMVRIRAQDSFGFLSLTASALALCGIRIVQAVIRTDLDRVDDVIWVQDRWGHKIDSEPRLRELRLSLILIEHFSSRLPRAADPESALVHFSRFATETMARPDWAQEFQALERPEVLDALVRVLGESHFLWEDYLHAQPETILPLIFDPAEWTRNPRPRQLSAELGSALASAEVREERCRALRQFRDREIFRADLRSILGLSRGLEQFSAELSDVAEVLLQVSYSLALEETKSSLTKTVTQGKRPSALFALGKFGGRELGFASDLEVLIVFDDRSSEPDQGAEGAGPFFDNAVAVMHDLLRSREGHTFDLDFRLRPYGRAGTPATSLSTFVNYYRSGGPAWGYERQVLVKLRPIAGDVALVHEIESHRDRFVYGLEPFDLEGCHRMRRLQLEQLVLPGTINAKYSPGAIVDIEYFVQALQIVHGSRDLSLRTPNTLTALQAMGDAGYLTPKQVTILRSSYRFFRMLIDAMRMVRGHAKDLTVPARDSDDLVLLARRLRLPGQDALLDELARCMCETRDLTDRLEDFLRPAPIREPTGV